MKLVACPNCHAQYDTALGSGDVIACRCGAEFPARPPAARDSMVRRCASCGALLRGKETACSFCRAEIVRDRTPAGPVCPECYARNPEGARHCTACGLTFQPQPIRSRPEPLECPVCPSIRFGSRSIGGLWVDECPQCLGLWAPGDVMDRLVSRIMESRKASAATTARGERHAAWQAQVVYRHCPECGGTMQRKNFAGRSGVVLDWCGSHGTWLDAHEMEDVAAFVMAGGLERRSDADAAGLPADPARTAAVVAAEQLLVEERERSRALRDGMRPIRVWKGIGDLFERLLG